MWDWFNVWNRQGHWQLRYLLWLELLIVIGVFNVMTIRGFGFDQYDVISVVFGEVMVTWFYALGYLGFKVSWWLIEHGYRKYLKSH